METSLVLDNRSKQLNLAFKKRFEHGSDVSLKLNGLVNTATSNAQVDGNLQKFFRLGREPRFSEDDIYRPDQRLRLGIGAKASSTSDDIHLSLSGKQKVRLAKSSELVRGREVLNTYTQATLQANYDYNVRTEAWRGQAVGKLSHAMFRFSDDQDLRITAGCRVPLSPTGAGKAEPFLRLEENCWSLTAELSGRGWWRIDYRL